MDKQAECVSAYCLGLIKTVGLTAAIEAADAAIKSANVHLMGYELVNHHDVILVKLEGEAQAVSIAVAAGCAAVSQIGEVYSHKIIQGMVDHQELTDYIDEVVPVAQDIAS